MRAHRFYSSILSTLPWGYVALRVMKDESYVESDINSDWFKFDEIKESQTRKIECIDKANALIIKYKEKCGIPGLSVSVNIDGKDIWSKGYGYSDVENMLPCACNSVFRVASISKAFTSILFGQLIDKGIIKLDEDIHSYVESFPKKCFDGKPVTITPRQLITHTAGIRHYTKIEEKTTNSSETPSDTQLKEFYLTEHYSSVHDALPIFQNDALFHAPGTAFLYTSHGFNLLSAVIENCANNGKLKDNQPILSFTTLMSNLFAKIGMDNSFAEENNPLIMRRVRYYRRVARGQLENTPYVDNSYKWAGGGFLSTVKDLCRFGHLLGSIYSGQTVQNSSIISRETLTQLWTPDATNSDYSRGKLWYKDGVYAMGWCVVKPEHSNCPPANRVLISHTGGAVGATSVLLISIPVERAQTTEGPPGIIVVAILTNLQDASGVGKVGRDLAKLFAEEYPLH